MSTNVLVIDGNLVRDPEVTYTTENKAVARITIAHNRGKNKDAIFLRGTAFGSTAEYIGKYATKGRKVTLTGKLDHNKWTDKKTGEVRESMQMVIFDLSFGDRGRDDDVAKATTQAPKTAAVAEQPSLGDEDIPF